MRCVLFCTLSFFAASGVAESPLSSQTTELKTITVTGEQPGPGLWKVSKNDHVMWILGTVVPLPRDIQWRPKELEQRIAQSQELLAGSEFRAKADVGFFGTLALFPSLIGIRNNPDGKTLDQVVPADMYARWTAAKRKYIGHSNRVERWRPIFAAIQLYDNAMDRNRLTGADYVRKQVLRDAERAHLDIVTVHVDYPVKNPRAVVKRFKTAPIQDIECFAKTLDRIDSDLADMTARANAWAVGDINTLRRLPQSDQWAVCMAAVSDSGIAHELGMSDIEARLQRAWLDAAKAALDRNVSTVSLVAMHRLLDPGGILAQLRALGYTIEAPDGDGAAQEDVTAPASR